MSTISPKNMTEVLFAQKKNTHTIKDIYKINISTISPKAMTEVLFAHSEKKRICKKKKKISTISPKIMTEVLFAQM